MAESDKEIIPRASNEFDPYDSNYPINLLAEGIGSSRGSGQSRRSNRQCGFERCVDSYPDRRVPN